MLKVLVTGGFGYLGGRLAKYLLEKGEDVTLLGKRIPPPLTEWARDFGVVEADITEPDELRGVCQKKDIVIHTAAPNEVVCRQDPLRALLVNGWGTRNMLEVAARESISLFIYLSTFHVYGKQSAEVFEESLCPNPIDDYSISHYLAELYCMQGHVDHGLNSVILRISNGYGAPIHECVDRWSLALNDFCRMAFEEGRIVLKSSGLQERDFVAISDICQAVELMIRNKGRLTSSVYNVGGGNSRSILSLAKAVARVFEQRYRKPLVIERPEDNPRESARPVSFSIGRIQEFGYAPRGGLETEIHAILDLLEGV